MVCRCCSNVTLIYKSAGDDRVNKSPPSNNKYKQICLIRRGRVEDAFAILYGLWVDKLEKRKTTEKHSFDRFMLFDGGCWMGEEEGEGANGLWENCGNALEIQPRPDTIISISMKLLAV